MAGVKDGSRDPGKKASLAFQRKGHSQQVETNSWHLIVFSPKIPLKRPQRAQPRQCGSFGPPGSPDDFYAHVGTANCLLLAMEQIHCHQGWQLLTVSALIPTKPVSCLLRATAVSGITSIHASQRKLEMTEFLELRGVDPAHEDLGKQTYDLGMVGWQNPKALLMVVNLSNKQLSKGQAVLCHLGDAVTLG